jgi:DNA-binding NtrC family response regulator
MRESHAVQEGLRKIERLVTKLSQEFALLKAERLALEVSALQSNLVLESGVTLPEKVRRFEISLITQALELSEGSQKRAAELLGLGPTTLHEKMRRYKLLRIRERTDPNERGR